MRTVVVTGSASGMGAAIRARLELGGDGVGEPARVIGVDLRGQEVGADLSTPQGRSEAIDGVLRLSGGSLDALVVCAGLGPHVRPCSAMVAVNYFAAVEMLDALLPTLGSGSRPAALAVCSNSVGLIPVEDPSLLDAMLDGRERDACEIADPMDGALVYGMTKIALTRAVRRRVQAWGEQGVRLNAVAPGPVLTPLLQGSMDDPVLGPLVDALPIPLGRRANPEELAEVAAFLLGPAAAVVHGAVLFADGGTDALVRPDIV